MIFSWKRRYDSRAFDKIREHYDIEKELAYKLKIAPRQERTSLYAQLYDELFQRVPHLTEKPSAREVQKSITMRLKLINNFLSQVDVFLEIGPGNCNLSLKMTEIVKQVYAVDVSKEVTKGIPLPKNFHLFVSDGLSFPIPDNTVDLVYSDQLMEHLHPEDAYYQLKNICGVLKTKGKYICITPHRFSGPHDISKYFDDEATGFHLKEYTIGEMVILFKKAGFSYVLVYSGLKGIYVRVPLNWALLLENVLSALPYKIKSALARCHPIKAVLGIYIIGCK